MKVLLLIALSIGLAQVAHSCLPRHAKPALSNTELMSQGMWRDPKTNMIWMRCSLGQTWNGSTCTGTASEHNWRAAQDAVAAMNRNGGFGGHTDWVLPDLEDLASLMRCDTGFRSTEKTPAKHGLVTTIQESCKEDSQRPTIDQTIFPNTPLLSYWSAYSFRGFAWHVSFDGVNSHHYTKHDNLHVRAVRAGYEQ